MASPPPLPPRDLPGLPPPSPAPPPYSVTDESPYPSSPSGNPTSQNNPYTPFATDPRSSSLLSLVPSTSSSDPRRTLLIVYIHGFYGNDQSFRSFPAHVHNYLRHALSDSHVIHSKVYPRYKTYKSIDVARDAFSTWLEPHESPKTDIILVGHSMGGLLAAEVALKPSESSHQPSSFKHNLLGTLSLDSPFLGLHPGIVVSGISSLFQPAASPPEQQDPPGSSQTADGSQPADPNFDPPFFNDEPFREQPFLARLLNFGTKHWSEGIVSAVANHITHHLEFGGCLADYSGLMSRYNQIRKLDHSHQLPSSSGGNITDLPVRIRFANYYTLSPGRPKPPPASTESSKNVSQADILKTDTNGQKEVQDELQISTDPAKLHHSEATSMTQSDHPNSSTQTPAEDDDGDTSEDYLSVKSSKSLQMEDKDDEEKEEEFNSSFDLSRLSMQELDPTPIDDSDEAPEKKASPPPSLKAPSKEEDQSSTNTPNEESSISPQKSSLSLSLDLPPIPSLPPKPEQPDFDQFPDKDSRKQAEKEFNRLLKTYDQSLKNQAKALREREKLAEKQQKKVQKDAEKSERDAKKADEKLQKEAKKEQDKLSREQQKLQAQETKRLEKEAAAATKLASDGAKRASAQAAAAATSSTSSLPPSTHSGDEPATTPGGGKPKKLKKFCNIPGKTNGVMDSTWVSVYMDNMDEVTAHCALFFPGPHYEKLVGDVGGRMVRWVQDDLSMRAIVAEEMGLD